MLLNGKDILLVTIEESFKDLGKWILKKLRIRK